MPCLENHPIRTGVFALPRSLRFTVGTDLLTANWSRTPEKAFGPIRDLAAKILERNGAPDTIRTCDLCLRRATLYPAELRVLEAMSQFLPYPIMVVRATSAGKREAAAVPSLGAAAIGSVSSPSRRQGRPCDPGSVD